MLEITLGIDEEAVVYIEISCALLQARGELKLAEREKPVIRYSRRTMSNDRGTIFFL
jgi:hypothetical protein